MSNELKMLLISGIMFPIVGGAALFFGWDVAVEKYLVPEIYNELKDESYIRDEISTGKFVSTNQESFNKNHIIDSKVLVDLNSKKYATVDGVDKKVSNISSRLDRMKKEEFIKIESQIKALTEELSVLKARELGKIELKVFYSNNGDETGFIVLNKRNKAISSLISNNEKYKVSSFNGNINEYKVRIQNLNDGEVKSDSAIARLFVNDYHKLFDKERSSGIGKANILLN